MTKLDSVCINTIRCLAIDAVEKANSGHPGAPMGMAPMAYVLWTKFLKHNPKNPEWENRDRFILSAGHASMLIYSLLHLSGYDLSIDDIRNFRQRGSKTPGHPELGVTPGVEMTTGPLGQGLGTAVGMAIAEKHLAERFNHPGLNLIDHYTYVIASDGDLMEGISHEAASLAGHLGLGKLIVLYDDNRVTIDGDAELTCSDDVKKRFESYGWHTHVIEKGDHDLEGIQHAIEKSQKESDKPSIVIVRTTIGFGSPNKQNSSSSHGAPLGADEVKLTKKVLGWPDDVTFFVPEEVKKALGSAVEAGQKEEESWKETLYKYAAKYPELAKEWKRRMTKELPSHWERSLPFFDSSDKPIATRSASGKVLNAVAPILTEIVQGSADLSPSTNTYLKEFGSFSQKKPENRNFHFGVREHAMGAIMNGLSLHGGFIPVGSTFLVFSDYMRPAIRLSALMKTQSIFVYTHDSIGLGEDGPTHQPIEHIASLRIIPGLTVIRPCDANETRSAWRIALERKDGPTALILTRQAVPVLEGTHSDSDQNVRKGAYVLSQTKESVKPDVILIATGSEVSVACDAKDILDKEGLNVRVVSMPSVELFNTQKEEYKNEVLPKDIKAKISIEAARAVGWKEIVGEYGGSISIERFGASAPAKVLMREFGFTAANVADRAREIFNKTK